MTYGPDLLATAAAPGLPRIPGLELELFSDTQWATAYLGGRPFATVQRARHDERDAPRWQAFTLDGRRFAHAATARGMVRLIVAAAAWASIKLAPPPLPSPRECIAMAARAARAAGFASPRALKAHVIGRGYVPGSDLAAFNRAQGYWLHVVCPLLWAADPRDAANRRAMVASAYKGAGFLYLAGRA